MGSGPAPEPDRSPDADLHRTLGIGRSRAGQGRPVGLDLFFVTIRVQSMTVEQGGVRRTCRTAIASELLQAVQSDESTISIMQPPSR
ncbi:hypothetical protein PUN4_180026 [Paraburkholderia unamae]|nr:hypothetical protein PUN4_180026 [Paraburkholderia unamae]